MLVGLQVVGALALIGLALALGLQPLFVERPAGQATTANGGTLAALAILAAVLAWPLLPKRGR